MLSDQQSAELPASTEQLRDEPFLSLKSGATEIYLIRHGDALPAVEDITAGDYDAQRLSELGRQQAQAAGDRLRETRLAAIYSSPIHRALETAEAIAAVQGLSVALEPDLREVGLGTIGPDLNADLPPDEILQRIKERLREIAVVAMTAGRWDALPGAEPSVALRARMVGAVQRLAGAHPGARIALVSHGGAINAYLAAVLGIERDYFFPTANASLSLVRVRGERAMLLSLNDIAHLRAPSLIGFDPNA
jgi:probable phosphoglycerate mutase